MTAQHTPGPWSVFDDIDKNRWTYGIDGGDGSAVVFYGTSLNDGIRKIEDARLIAAAPDLLAALQSIAECCDEDHAARDYASRQTEIRGIARAAIKKATNKEQA